jgi:PAS domain S-box-containing protein
MFVSPSDHPSEGTVPAWDERRQPDVLMALVAEMQDYAILMLDTEGKVATWNAGARRLKGYEAQEIIGRHFSVFYPPEDVAEGKPERELEMAAADGRLEIEGWRVRKDGTRFWANVVITALRDEDEELRGYGKVTRDITARVAGERRLRDRERQLADAQSLAGMGSWEWEVGGLTFTFSDELCRLVARPLVLPDL